MGIYINSGNDGFQSARNGEYIDKSGLIERINKTLFSEQRFSCVTRSRRFGKSMAAKMLCASYDHSCDSRELFSDLEIALVPSYEKHLNKYPVIFLDISDFVTRYNEDTIVKEMDSQIRRDVHTVYNDVPILEGDDLMDYLFRIAQAKEQRFIFIIDEWDAICREFKSGTKAMDEYVNWLRRLFKGGLSMRVFAAVYMTGILPIKKYDTQSALNNFIEYSMLEPRSLSHYFGFTKEEVQALASKNGTDYDELEKWYDGYQIGDEVSIFNPNSVIQAIDVGRCRSYWATTGAYDAVTNYIKMNYEGLKDNIIRMLAGERCKVDPTGFGNDMFDIRSKDDVLTVLIHLGYLSYNWRKHECYIPNREVAGELVNAVEESNWTNVVKALQQSEKLLDNTLAGNAEAVARGVEAAHSENTSILSYNDENSMACVLSIAYYFAHGDYIFHREFASGKGYADLVLIPRKNVDSPTIVIELKYGHSAEEAIAQIKERRYWEKVADYSGDILLVGICYDREAKTHDCIIEPLTIEP